MATRTIANGGGNWSAAGTWVEGAVPTAADDVVATSTSGALTIDAAAACRSLNLTGYVNTVTHNNFTLSIGTSSAPPSGIALHFPGTGWAYSIASSSSEITFVGSATGTRTCNFGGKTIGALTVNTSVGVVHQLVTSNVSVSGPITVSNGTLDLNGRTINAATQLVMSSANATLLCGSSTVNLSSQLNVTGGSVTAGTSTIALTGSTLTTSSAHTWNAITWTWSSLTTRTLSGTGLNCASLSVSVSGTSGNLPLSLAADITCSGALSLVSTAPSTSRLFVESNTNGTARTISAGSATLTSVDFQDITGAGAATWSGTSVGDGGGNTGITFTSPVTRYWVGNGGTWDGGTTHWSATSGGAGGASCPLLQDTVIFDANSFTIAGELMSLSGSAFTRHPGFDATAVTNNPIFAIGSIGRTFAGSIALPTTTAGNVQGVSNITLEGRGNHTIKTNGADWKRTGTSGSSVTIDAPGGTYSLADDFISSCTAASALFVTRGTFDANGYNVNISVGGFSLSGSSTRTVRLGGGTWTFGGTGTVWNATTVTGLTFTPGTSQIRITNTSASNKTFTGGGLTYADMYIVGGGTGLVTLTGANTWRNFTIEPSKSVRFATNTTNTFTGTITWVGTSGNVIDIASNGSGLQTTFSKATGAPVAADYLTLTDTATTGGALWYAGSHSTNASNNTGWSFTAAPPVTNVQPNYVSCVVSFPAAVVSTPGGAVDATVTPSAVACVASIPSAAITAEGSPTPAAISTVASIGAPVMSTGITAAPAAVMATTGVGSPVVAAGVGVASDHITALVTIPAASEVAGVELTPAPVTSTTAVAAPVLSAGGTASPGVVTSTTSLPVPVVGTATAASPAQVAATVLIYDPATYSGSTVDASPVIGGAILPGPSPSVGVTVSPTFIGPVAAFPHASISAQTGATVSAPGVVAVAQVGVPSVGAGAGPTPTSVGASTSLSGAVISGGGMAAPDPAYVAVSLPASVAQVVADIAPSPLALATLTPTALVQTSSEVVPVAVSAAVSLPPPIAVRVTWPRPGITSPQSGVTVPV